MRVTVNDIAKAANVSQTTVSRVLNNYPYVKLSTRKKVLEVIEELGFTPDSVARSMVTKKSYTLGLIVGDISNPYFAESAKIIIERAKQLGYDVILTNTNHNSDNLENAIQTLLDKRVDGILIASAFQNSKKIGELNSSKVPVMLFINKMENKNVNYVVVDNVKGAELAVGHLVQLGHEKIALISKQMKYSSVYERYIGYKKALKRHGLEFRNDYVFSGDTTESAYHFVDRLLSLKDKPTAFFAASDQLALEVLDAATNNHLAIPDDISVVGFDNMSITSNQFVGLTTISQHKEKMALLALEKLVLLIENGDSVETPIQVKLDPELIVRKTTSSSIRANKTLC